MGNIQNLVPGGRGRRTVANMSERGEMRYLDPLDVYKILHRKRWPYTRNPEYYHVRDLGLGSLLYLTCGRINEVLRLTKDQFIDDPDDPTFMVITQFWVSKRKKASTKKIIKIDTSRPIKDSFGNIIGYGFIEKEIRTPAGRHPIIDIPLPKTGNKLAPFTKLIQAYLDLLEDGERLFKIGTSRAWDIINTITGGGQGQREEGYWNHWFRSQSLSYQINLLRSETAVAKQRGIENTRTLSHYYRGQWKQFKDELKR